MPQYLPLNMGRGFCHSRARVQLGGGQSGHTFGAGCTTGAVHCTSWEAPPVLAHPRRRIAAKVIRDMIPPYDDEPQGHLTAALAICQSSPSGFTWEKGRYSHPPFPIYRWYLKKQGSKRYICAPFLNSVSRISSSSFVTWRTSSSRMRRIICPPLR